MFDTIGRHDDDEAPRRSFAALLITSLLLGGGAAFTMGLVGYKVAETIAEPEPEDQRVWLDEEPEEFEKPALPDLPRGLPGPVGPSGTAGDVENRPAEKPEPDAPPEADEPDPRVTDLPKVRPTANSSGTSGPPSNTSGGRGTGNCFDCGDGGGGGGDLYVHSSELEARRKPLPRYPEAAMGMDLGEQACVVKLRVDAKGFTQVLRVERCDPLFHEAAREALTRWRWYPKRVNGAKIAARTQVKVVFKP